MTIAAHRVGGMGGAGHGTGEAARPGDDSVGNKWCEQVANEVGREVAGHWCGFGAGAGAA